MKSCDKTMLLQGDVNQLTTILTRSNLLTLILKISICIIIDFYLFYNDCILQLLM